MVYAEEEDSQRSSLRGLSELLTFGHRFVLRAKAPSADVELAGNTVGVYGGFLHVGEPSGARVPLGVADVVPRLSRLVANLASCHLNYL